MRKHFLLLFLMALLPLAGWAEEYEITVIPTSANKTYGQNDPAVTGSNFRISGERGTIALGTLKGLIDDVLQIVRVQSGEDVNTTTGYSFRLAATAEYVQDADGNTYYIYPDNSQGLLYINPLDISGLTANTDLVLNLVNAQYYTGEQLTPSQNDFTVALANREVASTNATLTYGSDYTISTDDDAYGDNINVGAQSGSVKIVGTGNFTGEATLNFAISGVSIAGATVNYVGGTTGATLTYKGEAWEPVATDFTVTLAGATTPLDAANWQIKANAYEGNATYKDNINAGTGKVTIEGVGDYSGEVEATFQIAKYQVAANGLTIPTTGANAALSNPKFNGKAQKPTVNYNNVKVAANAALPVTEDDIEFTIGENINAGSYNATVSFKENGNYAGSNQTVAYSIEKKPMGEVYKNVTTTGITYTGSAITPEYVLKVANEEDAYALQLTTDYTIVATNNTAANTTNAATIKFKAAENGNFTGETEVTNYSIAAATLTVTPVDINASFGSSINPTVNVTGWKTDADRTAGYTGEVTYTYAGVAPTEYEASANKPTANGTYTITPNIGALEATNYTFALDAEKQTANLTISAGEVVLRVKSQPNLKYGDNAAAYSLEYVSGLSATDAAAFNSADVQNVAYELWNGETNVTATAVNTLNKGSYTIKAVVEAGHDNFEYGNYNVIINSGTLTINKRPLTDAVVAVNVTGAYTYKGEVFTIDDVTYTVKLNNNDVANDENANYTAATANNLNSTVDAEAVWNAMPTNTPAKVQAKAEYRNNNIAKVVITAAENGNFSGSAEAFFSIAKKQLNVTADDKSYTYGGEQPAYTAQIDTDDLTERDANLNVFATSSDVTAILKAKLASGTGNTIGEWYDQANEKGIQPYNLALKNYTPVYHYGKLTILPGELTLAVKDYNEKYGDAYDTDNFELVYVSGLAADKVDQWATLIDQTNVTYTAVDPANTDTEIAAANVPTTVGGTVKLKATGATSTNYNITYNLGTYTVVKRPIALKLENQNIDFGGEIDKTAEGVDAKISLVNIAGNNFIGDDNLADFVADETIKFVIADGADQISDTETENAIQATLNHANYELDTDNCVWGTLTVGAAAQLVLDNTANLSEAIEGYNGKSNIVVTFGNVEIAKEKWYAMVLPFNTSVQEFSSKLGYAIVDTLNEANNTKNIQFRLHMQDLPANKPFIFKVYKNVNLNTVNFTGKAIVYAENLAADGVAAKDEFGNKFIGLYDKKTGLQANEWRLIVNADKNADGTYKYDKWVYGSATNTSNVLPLAAYVQSVVAGGEGDDAAHFNAPIFEIEEANGSTTVIKGINDDAQSIDAEGWYMLNGMKMQGAPTQKGVYIQNGKKIVVK